MSIFRKVMFSLVAVAGVMTMSPWIPSAQADNGWWTVYYMRPRSTILRLYGNYGTQREAFEAMDDAPEGFSYVMTGPNDEGPND